MQSVHVLFQVECSFHLIFSRIDSKKVGYKNSAANQESRTEEYYRFVALSSHSRRSITSFTKSIEDIFPRIQFS